MDITTPAMWVNLLEEPRAMLLGIVFLLEYGSGMLLLYTYLRPSVTSPSQHPCKSSLATSGVQQLVWTGMVNVASALACYFLVISNFNPQISWLSYLQWGGATPPMIAVLCLVFGLDHATTILLVVSDLVVIILSYMSTYVQSELRIVTFALSCIHFIAIFGAFMSKRICSTKVPNSTSLLGSDNNIATYLLSLIVLCWFFQPISWLLSEGGLVYSHYSLDIARASFAVTAKVLFGIILLHYRAFLNKTLDSTLIEGPQYFSPILNV